MGRFYVNILVLYISVVNQLPEPHVGGSFFVGKLLPQCTLKDTTVGLQTDPQLKKIMFTKTLKRISKYKGTCLNKTASVDCGQIRQVLNLHRLIHQTISIQYHNEIGQFR